MGELRYSSSLPSTLETLKRYSGFGEITVKSKYQSVENSLSHTSKIETLWLHTQNPRPSSLAWDTFVDPSQLTNLSVKISDTNVSRDVVHNALDNIKLLTNLKMLNLECHLKPNHQKKLIESIRDKPLTHLSLAICPYNVENLLKSFKELQFLKLKIHSKLMITKDYFEDTFATLSQFHSLQTLYLEFYSERNASTKWVSKSQPTLQNVFSGLPLLEKFSLELDKIDGTDYFLWLIDSLKILGATLRTIRIDIGECNLSKDYYANLADFFKSIEKIECLELPTLTTPAKTLLRKIVGYVDGLKRLRVFELGTIIKIRNSYEFLESLEEIMMKAGLESFYFRVTEEFKDLYSSCTNNEPTIDINDIRKWNPSLEEYPRDIPIFWDEDLLRVYYLDAGEDNDSFVEYDDGGDNDADDDEEDNDDFVGFIIDDGYDAYY